MKKLSGYLIFFLFLVFIGYGLFELGKFLRGPDIHIETPAKYTTTKEPLIVVRGVVERAAYITLNDRQIFSDIDGNFEGKLPLPLGYTIITLKVRDRFDKEIIDRRFISRLPDENATIPQHFPVELEERDALSTTTATTTDELPD